MSNQDKNNQWNNSPEDATTPSQPDNQHDAGLNDAGLNDANQKDAGLNAWQDSPAQPSAQDAAKDQSAPGADAAGSDAADSANAWNNEASEPTTAFPAETEFFASSSQPQENPTQVFPPVDNTVPPQATGAPAFAAAGSYAEPAGYGTPAGYGEQAGHGAPTGFAGPGANPEQPQKRNRGLYILLGILVVIILALASFLGYRLWNSDDAEGDATAAAETSSASATTDSEEEETTTSARTTQVTTETVQAPGTEVETVIVTEENNSGPVYARETDFNTLDSRLTDNGWLTEPNATCAYSTDAVVYAGTNGSDYVAICAHAGIYTYYGVFNGGSFTSSATYLSPTNYNVKADPNIIEIRDNQLFVRNSSGALIASTTFTDYYAREF